jgi:hypothetical protein
MLAAAGALLRHRDSLAYIAEVTCFMKRDELARRLGRPPRIRREPRLLIGLDPRATIERGRRSTEKGCTAASRELPKARGARVSAPKHGTGPR